MCSAVSLVCIDDNADDTMLMLMEKYRYTLSTFDILDFICAALLQHSVVLVLPPSRACTCNTSWFLGVVSDLQLDESKEHMGRVEIQLRDLQAQVKKADIKLQERRSEASCACENENSIVQ